MECDNKMKKIKLSNKAAETLESARLLAQCDEERNISTSQMVELLAKGYLGPTTKSPEFVGILEHIETQEEIKQAKEHNEILIDEEYQEV